MDPGEATVLSKDFPDVRQGFVNMFEGIKGRRGFSAALFCKPPWGDTG
jgi:hypothetical protein